MKQSYKKYQVGSNGQPQAILEAGEVYRDMNGQINKLSENTPIHDDSVLVTNQGNKAVSNNNGGILLSNVDSVLSNTHNNREPKDKSYGIVDRKIKIKPTEVKELSKILDLRIANKGIKSPSDLFNNMTEARDNKAKQLTKFKAGIWSSRAAQNSEKANLSQAATLPDDNSLYDVVFALQESKKPIKYSTSDYQYGGEIIEGDEFEADDSEIEDLINQGYEVEYI